MPQLVCGRAQRAQSAKNPISNAKTNVIVLNPLFSTARRSAISFLPSAPESFVELNQ